MAKEEKKITAEDITSNVIISNGQEIYKQNFIRREYEEGDIEGNETISQHIEGGDGSVTNFAELAQGKSITRCDICTKQSQRIFFRKNIIPFSTTVRNCFYCRKNLCSRHFRIFENHIVCKRCMRIQKYIKPIFFKRVRES